MAYNPLTAIDPAGNRLLEDATDIAEAIIADLDGDIDGAHWTGKSRAFTTQFAFEFRPRFDDLEY